MKLQLLDFVSKTKAKAEQFKKYDEIETKQAMILPILQFLGWEVWDTEEVKPEHPVEGKKSAEGGRVDYCLRIKGKSEIFLEVKRPSEDLDRHPHQEQLLDYSFREGVDIAILSNGIAWWFYLPRKKGHWKERKFYAIDIGQQGADEIVEKFNQLLCKQNVQSGEALKNAEFILKEQDRQKKISQTLPKAWNKLIGERDPALIDLLAEITESICGFRPEIKDAEEFIRKNEGRLLFPPTPPDRPPSGIKEPHRPRSQGADIFGLKPSGKLAPVDALMVELIQNGRYTDINTDFLSKQTGVDFGYIRGHLQRLEKEGIMARVVKELTGNEANASLIPSAYKARGTAVETLLREIQQQFLEGLLQKINAKTNLFSKKKLDTVTPYICTGIGKGVYLVYRILKDKSRVELSIYLSDRIKNKAIFDALYIQKDAIEKEIGFPLEWNRKDEQRESLIRKTFNESCLDFPDIWAEFQDKMVDAMVKFEKAFQPRVKSIE